MRASDWVEWEQAKEDDWLKGVLEHRDGDTEAPWVGKPIMGDGGEAASQLEGFGAYLDEARRMGHDPEVLEDLEMRAWELWVEVRGLG